MLMCRPGATIYLDRQSTQNHGPYTPHVGPKAFYYVYFGEVDISQIHVALFPAIYTWQHTKSRCFPLSQYEPWSKLLFKEVICGFP